MAPGDPDGSGADINGLRNVEGVVNSISPRLATIGDPDLILRYEFVCP